MIWVVTSLWIHSPLPLCCQEGLEQAGSAWSQHLRDLLPHLPRPHQAAQSCQGEVDTTASPGRTCSSKYSTVVCCQVVLKCYQNYPKLYKRLGPTSKNGGLENFSLKVQSMKFLLEDLLTSHLRLSLPRKEF